MTDVPVRDTESAALIADESIKGYLPQREQIHQYLLILPERERQLRALGCMQEIRNVVDHLMVLAIVLVAPSERLLIEICDVPEHATCKEVLLDEAYKSLDFAFGKGVPRLTELGPEPDGIHERLVVFVPYRMTLEVSSVDNTFHVVGKDIHRYTHH